MSIVQNLIQYGDEASQFTVNLAADWVTVASPIGDGILSLTDTINKFAFKDNLNILSMGVFLPFGFEFYEDTHDISGKFIPTYIESRILRVSDKAIFVLISRTNMPMENYELNLGIFIEPDTTIGERFYLSANLPTDGDELIRVSMINVPAAFDEKVFHAPIFAKVEHTLAMEA